MPIQFGKSTIFGITDGNGYAPPDGSARNGRINRVSGSVFNAVDALAGSQYLICQIPASSIMLHQSAIKTTAWGFAQATVGVEGDPDALLTVAKATGGATGNTPVTIFGAAWNKPIWQQLGMAKDPGMAIDLIITTATDATIAGQIDFDLIFSNHI